MFSLFIYNEWFTNGYKEIFLDIVSLFAVLCGIFVLVSKNPIISILFLIGLFLNIAGYLILVGINFIGISYLVVYIGAISILFLFILMLINIRISELLTDTRNSIPLGILIGISFNYPINNILPNNNYLHFNIYSDVNSLMFNYTLLKKPINDLSTTILYYSTSDGWDTSLVDNSHITSIGNIMYTSHSIWLILTSMILLLAMIGAIVITVNQKNT